jgi:cell cycle sensor histidine kinase DivJ
MCLRIQSFSLVQPPLAGVSRFALAAACGLAAVALTGAAVAFASDIAHSGLLAPLQAAAVIGGVLWLAGWRRPADSAPAEDVVPLDAVVDLVTWHDANGDVLRASPGAAAVFGIAPAHLHGDGFLSRVLVADRPAFLKALSDAANGANSATVSFRIQRPAADGAQHPTTMFAEMRAHRILPHESAKGAAVIAFTRDVSDQHRHAHEIEAARRDAERANELKGRFLATVSHELRTPLNAIIGFSELLTADHPFLVTEDRRREYAQIIRSSGLHLLEIVNTLLDMSKIESGNFAFDPEPFDFRELASSVCDLMQLKADEAGVTVVRALAADLPEVMADRRACRQVLINLLSNAVKFTPAGGTVTVRVAANGEALVVSVADTGIGIPESDLPRLGDPFFQSGDVHRRNQEGTGLGLSVVRGIVGLHQGEIAVESGAGAGTTVTVTLPLRPDLGPSRTKPVVVQTRPRVALRTPERKIA